MDPLDDYAYNHLSDHLTDKEDELRDMKRKRLQLAEEGRSQYADALYFDKILKATAEVASLRGALRSLTETFADWSRA